MPALFIENMSIGPVPIIELLTIPELAELLKVSIPTVRRLQQKRQIPFVKVGGTVRFAKRDVAAYLERRRVGLIDE